MAFLGGWVGEGGVVFFVIKDVFEQVSDCCPADSSPTRCFRSRVNRWVD